MPPERRVSKGNRELAENQANQGQWDYEVCQVLKEYVVIGDLRAFQDRQEPRAGPDLRDNRAHRVRRDRLVLQAKPESRVLEAARGQWVSQG